MKKSAVLLIASFFLHGFSAFGTTYFVSTNGNDTANAGSLTAPFATISRAQQQVLAGDTVYIRGGKYVMTENQIARKEGIWASVHYLNKSGTTSKRINYWAYPGERPVFDMSAVKPAGYRVNAFTIVGSWIHLKGFEVVGTQVTQTGHTQSECFHNDGNNNIYENLAMHDGQAIGFYLRRGKNNLILNCDAYRNYDYTSEGGRGGNTDGFGCHPTPGGKGNVFRGCRAWFNSDDGYDCIRAAETVVFENCWAFYNGYDSDFNEKADGNGFKAGGWGLKKDNRVPDSIPGHIVRFCLAVKNSANGFYSNHHLAGSIWINNTAYLNATNFNMLNRNASFTEDVPGYGHTLINNVSFEPRNHHILQIDYEKCTLKNNYFQQKPELTKKDFVSVDLNKLTQPRNTDGSLPDTGFLTPASKSQLVDKGVETGFRFAGKSPDLGAFETKR